MMSTDKNPKAAAVFGASIRPGRIIAWTLLLIGGLIMVTPLLFMFSTSLKTAGQVYDLRIIPAAPTLENYIKVLSDGRFMRWFFNSAFVAVTVTLSNVFFDSLVGYTLAKFEFRGRYLSVTPFFYAGKTWLGIMGTSQRDYAAVIEPQPAGAFRHACLLHRVPKNF